VNTLSRDVLAILVSYLMGAIPFSYLIGRLRGGVDIREHGEGNVGARNVFHVIGPGWGALALVLDMGKGAVAYLAARQIAATQMALLLSGFAAPLGHNFSPVLRFKGGKGVATTGGFLLAMLPPSTLCGMALVYVGYRITRDMNKALVIGIPGAILLPPVFGAPLWTVPYSLFLFLALGVKKIIDRAHEQAVWARSPWENGQPGFHTEPTDPPREPR